MDYSSPFLAHSSQSVSTILANRKQRDFLLFITILAGTLCLLPLLIMAGIAIGFSYVFAIGGLLLLFVLVIRWPGLGFFAALICALAVDQSPLDLLGNGPTIYVFYWPPALQGLPDRPIGFFMLFVLLVLIIHSLLKRQNLLRGGKLLLPFLFLLLCVAWGTVHGLGTGGDLKITVNEVRSFWYLFLGYILAYNLVRTQKHLRYFFWAVIICAGIKALVGFYIYAFVIQGNLSSQHEIMAHEESYFWISILLLIVLFSLHHKYRPQFYTALAIIPFLLISLIANNRRADFLALLIGLSVAWVLIFVARPEARKLLIAVLAISLLLGGAYVAAFYKGQGGFSEPARAIVSAFHPTNANDAASNLYRDIEDYDLTYTVKVNPLGYGFGKPFLEPVPLPDISDTDPIYNYIPHNTIYWVWMRLGPIGYLALWLLFGAIIVRGCIYLRQLKDKYLQMAAIFIVCMVIMEIIVAYADYQLSFYRNVIYIGMLAGVLMKLPALDQEPEEVPRA
jgi:hypothetical protein